MMMTSLVDQLLHNTIITQGDRVGRDFQSLFPCVDQRISNRFCDILEQKSFKRLYLHKRQPRASPSTLRKPVWATLRTAHTKDNKLRPFHPRKKLVHRTLVDSTRRGFSVCVALRIGQVAVYTIDTNLAHILAVFSLLQTTHSSAL